MAVTDCGDTIPATAGLHRALLSMAASTVVHVAALLALALIATNYDEPRRPAALHISNATEDPEVEFDPLEAMAIDVSEPLPAQEPLPEAEIEPVADLDADAIDVVAADMLADPIDVAWSPLAIDGADLLATLTVADRGNGSGPARNDGGFGGEVGRRLTKAGAQTGAIQASLAWNNFNDIDLHVITPSGEHIFFGYSRSTCGGHLDVDMNANGPASKEPIENVYWPAEKAPLGAYRIFVHHFALHDVVDETPFEVHLLVDGVKRRHTGRVRSGMAPVLVAEFVRQPSHRRAGGTAAAVDDFRE